MREKKTQSHSIFAWRRSGFPYTNNSLDLFTGSHPQDPTYQDASCHCPLTLDDHICSPIYRLSTQWPETVYTDYNVHTACQWEHLPDPSLFCIINTPSKELWYTLKKLTHLLLWIVITIPVAHVGRFPLFGDVTRVVLLLPVWNNFPSLEKCLWRINKRHQFLGPFAFLWFTTPAIQRFPEHRHFFFSSSLSKQNIRENVPMFLKS